MQSISFGWVFAQPMAMIVVWTLGDFLFRISKNHYGFEKLESGFNARPIDYARFGLMFARGGMVYLPFAL